VEETGVAPARRLLRWGLLLAALHLSAPALAAEPIRCEERRPLRLHVYDVGQAAAALVELPDGRSVVVDVGGVRTSVSRKLQADLRGRPISLLWITHPHDDHLSHARAVLKDVPVELWVDSGLDGGSPSRRSAEGMGARLRAEARRRGVPVVSVSPASPGLPFEGDGDALRLTPVLPRRWERRCLDGHPNDCSIGLRIDYCGSSLLFLGDAEAEEERAFEGLRPATLLVVPHHGSRTSTSAYLLRAVRPRYAVISAGRPPNEYCHPARRTIDRLNAALGGHRERSVAAYDAERCSEAARAAPVRVLRSERLWITSEDGDVTLVTTGQGEFTRE
jgi:competence protein ComEC